MRQFPFLPDFELSSTYHSPESKSWNDLSCAAAKATQRSAPRAMDMVFFMLMVMNDDFELMAVAKLSARFYTTFLISPMAAVTSMESFAAAWRMFTGLDLDGHYVRVGSVAVQLL